MSGPSTPKRASMGSWNSIGGGGSESAKQSPSASVSGRSRLQSLAIETLLTSTLASVTATPPRLPVAKNKEPLSLPTTTRNFRGFVQKSGPIFYFQDAVEATLAWDDWAWTSMWMAIWAIVALQPYLLLCAPTAILSIILIRTHMARFPVGKPTDETKKDFISQSPSEALYQSIHSPASTGHGTILPPLMPNPPHEGTIKYYENLRDIQNMMRMIIDGYDAIAPTVPYLNWSSYRRTLLLFQASLILTALMFFGAPHIPLRPILLIAGESAFIATHPWVKPAIMGLLNKIDEEKRNAKTPLGRELNKFERKSREQRARLNQWYDEDCLDDEIWQKGWRDVEMYQNERFASETAATASGWSAHNLRFGERKAFTKGPDGWTAKELDVAGYSLDISRQVAMSLEPGWAWVDGDDWRIDWIGEWTSVGVDAEGFVYTDTDWHTVSPYPYGHVGHPDYPPVVNNDNAKGFSLGELFNQNETEDSSVFEDDDENNHDSPTALTGMEFRAVKAETRRRRWLRRAVWIGTTEVKNNLE